MIIETCPKCGDILINSVICTEPPTPCKDCPSCGWHWERTPEPIEYRPFGGDGDGYNKKTIKTELEVID